MASMRHRLFLLPIVLAVALSACGERPPRADPEGRHAYAVEPGPNPVRDRTLKQGAQ